MTATPARRAATSCRTATIFTVLILLGSGCASDVRELMPTPAIFQVPAAREIFDTVPAARRSHIVDLLYITDRAPDPTPQPQLPYGQQRSRQIAFGAAEVALLPAMDWQELTHQSLADPRKQPIELRLVSTRELGTYPLEPYPLQRKTGGSARDPIVMEWHRRSNAALQAEVARRLAEAPSGEVMLYVHGFNETFATAAYTAAELCHFFGRTHLCSFFTWPAASTGNPLTSYASTTESAQYSVGHLKKAIRTIARTPGVQRLHLLAHSRGTALLLYALRELSLEAVANGEDPADAFKFGHWVLMSPDIDAQVASQQLEIFASDPDLLTNWHAPVLPRFLHGRLTIYTSPEDRALKLSKFLFRSTDRVGQLKPEDISPATQAYFATTGNVDIIVYEGRRTDPFGHSYFTSNPRVSADLVELVRNGTPPGAPGRPLIRRGKVTWELE